MDYEKIRKVSKDREALMEFKRDAMPRKNPNIKPPSKPSIPYSINTEAGAVTCDMPQQLFHEYLRLAANSDNPLIQHKLRELIALTKLVTDSENPEIARVNRDLSTYNRLMAEYKEALEAEEVRYTEANKLYNLQKAKMFQDLRWYCEDYVSNSLKDIDWEKPTVWQQMLLNVLEEQFPEDLKKNWLSNFMELDDDSKTSIVLAVGVNHRKWINDTVEEIEEEKLVEMHFDEQLLDMEDELYSKFFDEDGNPLDESRMYRYESLMNDLEDQLRCDARSLAISEVQARWMEGMDGYEQIYSFCPVKEKDAA